MKIREVASIVVFLFVAFSWAMINLNDAPVEEVVTQQDTLRVERV